MLQRIHIICFHNPFSHVSPSALYPFCLSFILHFSLLLLQLTFYFSPFTTLPITFLALHLYLSIFTLSFRLPFILLSSTVLIRLFSSLFLSLSFSVFVFLLSLSLSSSSFFSSSYPPLLSSSIPVFPYYLLPFFHSSGLVLFPSSFPPLFPSSSCLLCHLFFSLSIPLLFTELSLLSPCSLSPSSVPFSPLPPFPSFSFPFSPCQSLLPRPGQLTHAHCGL